MKKRSLKLLSLLFVVLMLCQPTLAIGVNDNFMLDAEYLTKDEVLSIVQLQIDGYISTSIDTTTREIIPANTFIDLHDIDGNVFAYLVPLLEKNVGPIGYIVVGALRDGYATYAIDLNKGALEELTAMLNGTMEVAQPSTDNMQAQRYQIDTAMPAAETSLIFIPPMAYLIKVESGGTVSYYDINGNRDAAVDVTDNVEENLAAVRESYSLIRSQKHKEKINGMLSQSNISPQAVDEIVDVYLSDVDEFIAISYQNKDWYGGNQEWYSLYSCKSNGCGPTAAANITCYLAQHFSKFSKLYPYSTSGTSTSQANFLRHMDTMYSYILPDVFGETSVTDWTEDVIRYANDKGCSLSSTIRMAYEYGFPKATQKDRCIAIIKSALGNDYPVGALNLQNQFVTDIDYAWHWMTITRYFSHSSGSWIDVSTFGKHKGYDFDAYYDALYAYGGGFAYFK
jgi:hypothetical protein